MFIFTWAILEGLPDLENAQSQTTVWTATSSGHYVPKHFMSKPKGMDETSEITTMHHL